jgi:hypothetical protein
MSWLDDELQTHLELIESGVPVDDVLIDMQPAFLELAPLIRLAATFRETPIPEPHGSRFRFRRPGNHLPKLLYSIS